MQPDLQNQQSQPNQPNNQDPKQELVLKLKDANNILVTVSANPSVDQLSAAIGLTILLNKLKKHATAVFSGNIPSTIEFLKPEETLEKNTDSLRDFIIALDKSKADKLRYKVEENIVKIFITPYKTSITQDDLDFSQGDFNVDVVLALGVRAQQDLDQAITAHGRILHDATVIAVNTQPGSELGVINWTMPNASSLSELAVVITDELGKDMVDGQIATALLTGIVAETARFSNEKTSPETMRLSAELMSAGANQQLVASQLQQPGQSGLATDDASSEPSLEPATPKPDDGTLEITHPADEPESAPTELPAESPEPLPDAVEPKFDDASSMPLLPPSRSDSPHRIVEPPVMSGQLTANTESEDAGVAGGLPLHEPDMPILGRDEPAAAAPLPELELPQPLDAPVSAPLAPLPPADTSAPLPMATGLVFEDNDKPLAPAPAADGTLADIEQAVHSPHAAQAANPTVLVDDARNAVLDAINSIPSAEQTQPPKADVGAAGYLNVQENSESPVAGSVPYVPEPIPGNTPADTPLTMPLPPTMQPLQPTALSEPASQSTPPPPPVPPPMTDLPPFVNPNK